MLFFLSKHVNNIIEIGSKVYKKRHHCLNSSIVGMFGLNIKLWKLLKFVNGDRLKLLKFLPADAIVFMHISISWLPQVEDWEPLSKSVT